MQTKLQDTATNAVIYARFSSDKQREESIEGQVRECRAFAEANGLNVIHIYTDRAKSAKTDNRPDFLKMVRASTKGLFSYIIVYTLDRFSRSRYDSVTYKAKLKKNGVKVLSAKENIRDDPSGIILESVLEGYAEYYSAELAQKVKRGMTDSVIEKKWPGSEIPFGFNKNADGTLLVDPVAGPAAIKVFEDFVAGRSRAEIVRDLAAGHFTTATGRAVSYAMITRMLKNELYTGRFSWGSLTVPNFVEPIITRELFNAAQKLLTPQARKRRNAAIYTLTGKIQCGACHATMTGVSGTSKNGSSYHYYRCASKSNRIRGTRKPCSGRNIQVEPLEKVIFDTTLELLNTPEAREEIARQAVAAQKRDHANDETMKALRQEKADLKKRLANSIKAIEAGVVSTTITRNIQEYEERITEIDNALADLKLRNTEPEITADAVEFYLFKLAEKAEKEGKADLNVFFDFIQKVEVMENTVRIYYSYLPTKRTPNPIEVRCSYNDCVVTPE